MFQATRAKERRSLLRFQGIMIKRNRENIGRFLHPAPEQRIAGHRADAGRGAALLRVRIRQHAHRRGNDPQGAIARGGAEEIVSLDRVPERLIALSRN